jgi:hypothetical protein
MKIDRQYSSSTQRIADELKVSAGEVALDSDTGSIFHRTTSGWLQIGLESHGQYPVGATPVTASSGNVAAAIATATLPAVSGKTTYVSGFEITNAGATAASNVIATLAGIISGTSSYIVSVVAGATLGNRPLIVQFSPAIPASAVNTAITLSVPSLGAGNTHSAASIHGYYL